MIITRDSGYRYSLAAVVLLAMAIAGEIAAQQTDPTEGLRQDTPRVHAFTDARIVVEPGRVFLENGTLVIRNGIIEAVGADVRVPADARASRARTRLCPMGPLPVRSTWWTGTSRRSGRTSSGCRT